MSVRRSGEDGRPPRPRAGQQRVRPHPVAVGGGVEAVVAERARRRPGTPAPVSRGQVDHRRRRRSAPRRPAPRAIRRPVPADELAQRRRDRADRAQVRAGADDDRARRRSRSRRTAAPGSRRPRRAARSGSRRSRRSGSPPGRAASPSSARATWVARSVEREPETRDAGQRRTRRPPGLGEQLGELAADGLGDPVDADAERGRVAEQHQAQRRRARPADRGAHGQAQVGLAYRRVRAAIASAGEQRGAADGAGDQR